MTKFAKTLCFLFLCAALSFCFVSCGLIAGLQRNEIDRMRPGEVLDLYFYRQEYDSGRM